MYTANNDPRMVMIDARMPHQSFALSETVRSELTVMTIPKAPTILSAPKDREVAGGEEKGEGSGSLHVDDAGTERSQHIEANVELSLHELHVTTLVIFDDSPHTGGLHHADSGLTHACTAKCNSSRSLLAALSKTALEVVLGEFTVDQLVTSVGRAGPITRKIIGQDQLEAFKHADGSGVESSCNRSVVEVTIEDICFVTQD